MFRTSIVSAAVALWLAASPAAAEPFEHFIDMCLKTNANAASAAEAALKAGWHREPAEETENHGNELFAAPVIYLSDDPATGDGSPEFVDFLMTRTASGEEMFGVPGTIVEACSVVTEGDLAAQRARMARELGFGPLESSASIVWLYSRDGDDFHSEAALADVELDATEMLRLLRERQFFFAMVTEVETGTVAITTQLFRPAD